MSSKKKLIKSTLTTTAVAAMAVTAGAVANTTAHADTVNNTSDNSQQPSPAISNLKQAQDQSRQAYANADQANTSAQAELNKAQSADQAAQSNLASATKAQSLAQDAVNTANANQKQAQSAYDTAVNDAKKNDADTDSINQLQTQAEQAVSDAQAKVDTVTNDVTKAQEALNQTNTDLDNANATVEQDTDKLNQAKKDLNDVKEHQHTIESIQKTIDQDQASLKEANNAVTTAQGKVDTASANAQQANADLKNAKNNLKQIENKQGAVNTLKATSDYINKMKDAKGNSFITDQTEGVDFNGLAKASKDSMQLNQYQSDPAAKQVAIHFNSNGTLSHDDVVYASQYAAQLVNPLRQQLGTPLYQINKASVDIAQDVVNQYRTDKWNPWERSHDFSGLKKVGQKWGANVLESWAGDMSMAKVNFNDDGVWVSSYDGLNRDDLQHGIYDALKSLLFDDADQRFGHTTDILGIRYPADYADPKTEPHFSPDNGGIFLGVSYTYDTTDHVSNWAGQKNLHEGGFHFDSEGDPNSAYLKYMKAHHFIISLDNPSTLINQPANRVEIAIPTNDHTKLINDAKTAVNTAQTKADQANDVLKAANNVLEQAKSKQADLQDNLKSAQNKLAEEQQKAGNPVQLQHDIEEFQAQLNKNRDRVTNLTKQQASDQTALKQATDAQKSAKTALEIAQNKLESLQDTQGKDQHQSTVLVDQNKAVKDADSKLQAANKALKDAQAKLSQANTDLKNAKAKAEQTAKDLKAAQTKAMETKAALQKAKDALITDAKVYGESVSLKPIVTIHVGDPAPVVEIANPMAKDPTQSLIASAFLKMASSKLDTIPEGTKADWADAKKVANDIKNVGNYTEDITVTFPDSSTTKLSAELSVLAAVKPEDGKSDQDKTDKGDTPVSKPEDSKSDQGKTEKGNTPVSKPEDGKSDQGKTEKVASPKLHGYTADKDSVASQAAINGENPVVTVTYSKNAPEKVTDQKLLSQTIRYQFSNGVPAHENHVQTVLVKRTGEKDAVSGEITWGPWDEVSFKAVKSPEIDGYEPDVKEVDAVQAVGNTDTDLTVTYHKVKDESATKNDHQVGNRDNDNVTPATATNNETATPVTANNSTSANVTTTSPVATTATPTFTTREQVRQTAQQLPQTGNHNNVAVAVLGAITGLFGFGLAAKRRERN